MCIYLLWIYRGIILWILISTYCTCHEIWDVPVSSETLIFQSFRVNQRLKLIQVKEEKKLTLKKRKTLALTCCLYVRSGNNFTVRKEIKLDFGWDAVSWQHWNKCKNAFNILALLQHDLNHQHAKQPIMAPNKRTEKQRERGDCWPCSQNLDILKVLNIWKNTWRNWFMLYSKYKNTQISVKPDATASAVRFLLFGKLLHTSFSITSNGISFH